MSPRTTKRGGASASALRVAQIAITTAILIASSILLIQHYWAAGFVLLIVGTVLAMINSYRS